MLVVTHHCPIDKKEAKTYILTKENEKKDCNAVTLTSNFNLITGLEIVTR